MGLDDQKIYQNLTDPTKFRSAFPEYSKMSDGDIKVGIARFASKYQSSYRTPAQILSSGLSGPVGGSNEYPSGHITSPAEIYARQQAPPVQFGSPALYGGGGVDKISQMGVQPSISATPHEIY